MLDLSFLAKGTVLYDELNDESLIVGSPDKFKITLAPYSARILILRK